MTYGETEPTFADIFYGCFMIFALLVVSQLLLPTKLISGMACFEEKQCLKNVPNGYYLIAQFFQLTLTSSHMSLDFLHCPFFYFIFFSSFSVYFILN
jgi:hypothetical protein